MPWTKESGRTVRVGPEVDTRIAPAEVETTELTPKQTLQQQAETLGVEFTERTTIAELEELIAEAE